MKEASSAESFCTSPDEQARKHHLSIRKYLNVDELVAVGIREEVLDPEVCYSYCLASYATRCAVYHA
ncbi:hypothetical protein V5279_09495 [Bradyrhizobium sp. 26S5]|uniref:DUF4760 domain-containing protein n=1 Tax=Bradyrhizobium sp. 26S5 TaxID=3139729 RepID=UPI0030D1685E